MKLVKTVSMSIGVKFRQTSYVYRGLCTLVPPNTSTLPTNGCQSTGTGTKVHNHGKRQIRGRKRICSFIVGACNCGRHASLLIPSYD
eukprot:UN18722